MTNEIQAFKSKEQIVKWGLVVGTVGVGGYYLTPYILAMAIGWLQISAIVGVLTAFFYLYPAFCESLASLSFKLWAKAIRSAPIERMKRDLENAKKQIDDFEKNIAGCSSGIALMEKTVNDQRQFLTPEDITEFMQQVRELKANKVLLIEQRDEMIYAYNDFSNKVKRYEAKHQVGGAFKKSLNALKLSQNVGVTSEGSQIAFDQVDKELEGSRSALQLAMSRPRTKIQVEVIQPKLLVERTK